MSVLWDEQPTVGLMRELNAPRRREKSLPSSGHPALGTWAGVERAQLPPPEPRRGTECWCGVYIGVCRLVTAHEPADVF